MASEAPPAPATASTPTAPPPAATAAPAAESPVKQEPSAVAESAPSDAEHPADGEPQGESPEDWKDGLCGHVCGGDCGTCLSAFFCPCFLHGRISERLQKFPDTDREHMTLVNDSCLFHCIAQLPFKWLTVMGQRRKVRDRFGIGGTRFKDCCATFWCAPCASAQMNMELKNRAAAAQPPVAEEPPAQPAMAYTPPPGSPAPADPPSEKPAEPALPLATAPPPKDKALPPPPGIVNTPALIH
ncbi:hypothetical protein D0862_01521 [Hortaea werneckii]|uniref:PLAC8 family protein n=1 Tax=Hortaea werneckii TaxID=91943 RepID=A0A3M7HRC9_HORWE|nr:hypothetical protein D0862_01521 [Hortaea werneckii]